MKRERKLGQVSYLKSQYVGNKLLWRPLYTRWHSMLNRCYNKSDLSYKNYGKKGVFVTERWFDFCNFIDDVTFLPGWDEVRFLNGELELDKDSLQFGLKNRTYSLETCVWISRAENTSIRNKENLVAINFIAISPGGVKTKEYNTNSFAKNHSLFRSNICECLKGRRTHTKGWKFYYEN